MAESAPPPADVQSSAGAAHHKIHKRDVWTFIDKIRSIKYWDLHDAVLCANQTNKLLLLEKIEDLTFDFFY